MERSDGIVKSFKTSLKNLIGLKSENVSSGENAIGTSLQQTTIGLLNNLLNKARMEHRTLSEKISNKKTDGLAIEEVPQVSKTQKQELVFTRYLFYLNKFEHHMLNISPFIGVHYM